MTIEHFREIDPNDVRQTWASKPIHHVSRGGTAKDMPDWLANEKSRAQFRQKLAWLQKRFGDQPAIFGWELWNEINAVRGGDYMGWTRGHVAGTEAAVPQEPDAAEPGQLRHRRACAPYQRLRHMPDNDVAQVHRYLDLGAPLEVCQGRSTCWPPMR